MIEVFSNRCAGVVGLVLLLAVQVPEALADASSIEGIRAEYAAVSAEKLSAFEIPFEAEEISGKLTLRYRGGEIRSAVAERGAEHGWERVSSYYKDGAPFFVLVERGAWGFVEGGGTMDSVEEARYYIVDGKVIRTLEKKYSGRNEEELKAAALKAENREVEVAEGDTEEILKKVRLIVAARNAGQVIEIMRP